jgi:hypothetical protein
MNKWKIASLVVFFGSNWSFASENNDQQICAKWVSSYLEGLTLGEELISQNPSYANPKKRGLTIEEIERLQKTKSSCEVKAKINEALNNR